MKKIKIIQQSPELLKYYIGRFADIGYEIERENFILKKLTNKDISEKLFNKLRIQACCINRFNDTLFDFLKYKELENEARYVDFFDNLIYRKGRKLFGVSYTHLKTPVKTKYVFYIPSTKDDVTFSIFRSSGKFSTTLEKLEGTYLKKGNERKLKKYLSMIEFLNLLYFEFNEVYDRFLKGPKLYGLEVRRNFETFKRVKDGILETINDEYKPEEERIETKMLIDNLSDFIDSDNKKRELEKLFEEEKYKEIKDKLFSIFYESLKPVVISGGMCWVSDISFDPLGIKAKDITIGISKLNEDKEYVDKLENLFKEYENLYKKKRFDYEKCFEVENKVLEAYKEDSYWKVGFDR